MVDLMTSRPRTDHSVATTMLDEHANRIEQEQAAMHAYYQDGQYAEDAFQLVQEHARRLMSGERAAVIVLADHRKGDRT